MSDLISREDAARIAEDFNLDIWEYSTGNRSRIGHDPVAEAIRALPAVQPDAREAALREALAAVNAKWRSGAADTPDEMRGLALAEAAIFDLLDKPGKDNSHE